MTQIFGIKVTLFAYITVYNIDYTLTILTWKSEGLRVHLISRHAAKINSYFFFSDAAEKGNQMLEIFLRDNFRSSI